MVEEATINLDNKAYLTIVYGSARGKIKITPYKTDVKKSSINLLNTPLKSNIATVALAGITSSIGQNIAGKKLSNATLGRINSSIYDIMSDGKISTKEVAEDFIGSCTNSLDNMFTDLGYFTPSALYTALMPFGTGVISKDFANLLGKVMDKENKKGNEKVNAQTYDILQLPIVTSDKETWAIDIPTRKTEKGFEIATSISNHNKAKDFEVLLCSDKSNTITMYDLKNTLNQIRDMQEPFDIYIADNDIQEHYTLKNCLFSNLDFAPNGRNSLNCSMSVVQIPEWDIQIVKLDSSYKGKYSTANNTKVGKAGSSSSKKAGISKVAKTAESVVKTAESKVVNPKKLTKITPEVKNWIKSMSKKGNSIETILKQCQKRGVTTDRNHVVMILSEGLTISAKK